MKVSSLAGKGSPLECVCVSGDCGGGREDGTLLGLVLLLCNLGNRQDKSGHSLPGSARGKKNVKGGEGREPHVITPVMPCFSRGS